MTTDPQTRVLACQLFDDLLSALESDTIRTHILERTGVEATVEQLEGVNNEWDALRRYIENKKRKALREVGQADSR